jgi:hypothetical protein
MPKPPEFMGTGSAAEVPRQVHPDAVRPHQRWNAWMAEQLRRFQELSGQVFRYKVSERVQSLNQGAQEAVLHDEVESSRLSTTEVEARIPQVEVDAATLEEVQKKITIFRKSGRENEKALYSLDDDLFVKCLPPDKKKLSKNDCRRLLEQAARVVTSLVGEQEEQLLAQLSVVFKRGKNSPGVIETEEVILTQLVEHIPQHWLQAFFVFVRFGTPQLAHEDVLDTVYRKKISSKSDWLILNEPQAQFDFARNQDQYPRQTFSYFAEGYTFGRLKLSPEELADAERIIILGKGASIAQQVQKYRSNYVELQEQESDPYHVYLKEHLDRRPQLRHDVVTLRRFLTGFLNEPSKDHENTQNLVSMAIDLSENIGVYDEGLRLALRTKYDLLAGITNWSTFSQALENMSSVRGFALNTEYQQFFKVLTSESLNDPAVYFIHELLIAIQLADQDPELLGSMANVLNTVIKMLRDLDPQEVQEITTVAGTLQAFGTHLELLQTTTAESYLEHTFAHLQEKLSKSHKAHVLAAGQVLARLPVRYADRSQQSVDQAEVREKIGVEGRSEQRQLYLALLGRIVAVLDGWDALDTAVASEQPVLTFFAHECEERLLEAIMIDSRNSIKFIGTRWEDAQYPLMLNLANPLDFYTRTGVWSEGAEAEPYRNSMTSMSQIESAAWHLVENFSSELSPQQQQELLVIAETALRGLLANSFNFNRVDYLINKVMEKRIQVLAPTDLGAARSIREATVELLNRIQTQEFWDQELQPKFLSGIQHRRQADLLIHDRRARLFLRRTMQRLGMLREGDETWERLDHVISQRVEQLRAMGVSVTEKKK